ncbi:MAG: PIN domain-containing protein [Thermoanaerobaculia bacterium]
MIAYVDSSVLLRLVLGERGKLKEWRSIERALASALLEVECLRALDRLRFLRDLGDKEFAARREAVYRLMEPMEVIEVNRSVLIRASQPFPTVLRTLDVIHLASALLWREQSEADLVMATHDAALAIAARANGLRVVGV